MKYAYPAVLTYEKSEGVYYVNFPDIENCFTDGRSVAEALEMGEDALTLMLCRMEDDGIRLPEPTDIKKISLGENETATLVFADTDEYRRENAVKRIYYPAVFHPEERGYSVSVPDLDGCFSQGETAAEAAKMAVDAIGLYLDGGKAVPAASRPEDIKLGQPDFIVMIPYEDK